MHHGDIVTQRVHRFAEHLFAPVQIFHGQQVHRIEDDAQIGTLYCAQHNQGPFSVIDDVIPHGLNCDDGAKLLRVFHHRLQIPHEGAQRFGAVRIGVHFIFGVGRAGLGTDHADARLGGNTQAAVIPRLELADLLGIRMSQIQIAAQHCHVKFFLLKYAAHMGGKPLGQGGVVKGDAGDTFGKRQMYAGKALFPGFMRTRFQRLLGCGQRRVDIVKTDTELHVDPPCRIWKSFRQIVVFLCKL